MAADEKWYFTKEQLQFTPSRRCGFDADKELSYRQQAANFIQDMGQKLQVSQLCINTAIVYMHRFYMFHSFTHFPWNTIAAASFFLAAKVEEQPRKLEHVIRVANHCLHREQGQTFDAKSEQYAAQSQDLVFNENVLLQTLGFDVAIDHPHTHVVRCCHLVRASKDLAQTSYFMASNSLHLTTMCLQYKPTVVACFCIHLACKWSNWQIPKSNEGKDWFYYVDKSVTSELLEQLTAEFLKIFDKCPSRLKRKISSISTINQNHGQIHSIDHLHAASSNSPFDPDTRKLHEGKDGPTFHPRVHHDAKPGLLATPEDPHKKSQRPHDPSSSQYREYREKKERLEREKAAQHHGKAAAGGKHMAAGAPPPGSKPAHHRPQQPPANVDPAKMKLHHRPVDASRESLGHGGREHGKELVNGRDGAHRDHQKQRDFLAAQQQKEASGGADGPVKVDSAAVDKQRYDASRQKVADPKLQLKQHEAGRHRRDLDPKYQKRATGGQAPGAAPDAPPTAGGNSAASASASAVADANKSKPVPVSSSAQDKQPNSFISKQINSTSQRHKSPFSDAPKSVPAASPALAKADARNGSHAASAPDAAAPPADDHGLLSPPPALPKKPPSLFSPEKTPPHKKPWTTKTPPSTGKRTSDTPQLPGAPGSVPPAVSPFGSPPPAPKLATPTALRRPRTASSGSEPELRPVVKKLDQISGFENIIRDSKMGIKLPKVPDIIQPICDRAADAPGEASISKELRPPDLIKPFNTSLVDSAPAQPPLVNGIETDPAVISTLLKEVAAPPANHLLDDAVAPAETAPAPLAPAPDADKHRSEHHHKSEKKKKKDKHKHKDKDKSKDEKKKKHKDKDKERHKIKTEGEGETPLKITISKEKLQPVVESVTASVGVSSAGSGLKVKISKDRLKKDVIAEPPPPNALKIKISKDQIQQYSSVVDSNHSGSRKRERDKQQASPTTGAPPPKVAKGGYGGGGRDSSRQNGRNSYNKVAQIGEGEASQLRLAESKYHSKGASKAS